MKKIFFLIFLFPVFAFGQWVELIGGVNQSFYYDRLDETPHYSSNYTTGNGYSFSVAADQIYFDSVRFRLELGIHQYSGELFARNGALGGSYSHEIYFSKTLLSLSVYPINFSLFENLRIGAGLKYEFLLFEDYNGYAYGWQMAESWTKDINDQYDSYANKSLVGVVACISYHVQVTKKVFICPQYTFTFGLNNEFKYLPDAAKAFRQYLQVGIGKQF